MKITFYATFFFFFLANTTLFAQNNCNDPQAKNTGEKGTCEYPRTKKSLKRVAKLDPIIKETSGLIEWDGSLWTINDSGGEPVVYRFDPETGKITQEVRVENGKNVDWEEIAQDENHIYIGDFGNNLGYRKDLSIFKIKKSDITSKDKNISVKVEKTTFYYPQQKNFTRRNKQHNFDCEAFFYHNNQFHLLSKNWKDSKTYHYTVDATTGHHEAILQDSFDVKGLITGADINENGTIVLVGYTPMRLFMWILSNYKEEKIFTGNCRRIELGYFFCRGQMEGICFSKGMTGYISAEGFKYKKQNIRKFDLNQWIKKDQ